MTLPEKLTAVGTKEKKTYTHPTNVEKKALTSPFSIPSGPLCRFASHPGDGTTPLRDAPKVHSEGVCSSYPFPGEANELSIRMAHLFIHAWLVDFFDTVDVAKTVNVVLGKVAAQSEERIFSLCKEDIRRAILYRFSIGAGTLAPHFFNKTDPEA
jgi:hypothetical protein